MKLSRQYKFVFLLLWATISMSFYGLRAVTAHTFRTSGREFLLDEKPFIIISGEMHYPRIPQPYWRDRMRKAKAMGLNTISTYIFWNAHEPNPGQFDFSGNLDIADFIRTAQEEGLWVLIRPGPYVCAEWDLGGLPAWLLKNSHEKIRSSAPFFLEAAKAYIQRIGKELAPLQVTNGGPILMVQVENEYGSFGADKGYLHAIRQMLCDAGFDTLLFTADGTDGPMLTNGTLPTALTAINFGFQQNPQEEFARFEVFRPNAPRLCAEFWIGWFDHWGKNHHIIDSQVASAGLDWMLSHGISCNLFLFHGGTSFGFMNGANHAAQKKYYPDISSYDYDAPLDEAGRPRKKFFALRDVIRKHLSKDTSLPDLPKPLPMIEIPPFELTESASLFSLLDSPIVSIRPQTMEELDQTYGLILYRKLVDRPLKGRLNIEAVHDYATVLHNSEQLATLDRRLEQTAIDLEIDPPFSLDILVENMGRVNFGPDLVNERKGIIGKVTLDGEELLNWEQYPLPLNNLHQLHFSQEAIAAPAFHRGTFQLESVGDTFLDMRGWGKGHVWVNGHHLGRFWHIGPQYHLFIPGCWLNVGANELIVLDVEKHPTRLIQSSAP
jgi:beta-galactosidase